MKSKNTIHRVTHIALTSIFLVVMGSAYTWHYTVSNKTPQLFKGHITYHACHDDRPTIDSGDSKKINVGGCMLKHFKGDLIEVRPKKEGYGVEQVVVGHVSKAGPYSGNAHFTITSDPTGKKFYVSGP